MGAASGKTILFGEHSVVYGHPALALPVRALTVRATATPTTGAGMLRSTLFHGRLADVPERLRPTAVAVEATLAAIGGDPVDVAVHSDIPAERGVGSSAAVAAALVAAVADAHGVTLTPDERHDLVQAAERAAHGSPSGLDARTVVAASPVWFRSGIAQPVAVGAPLSLVIADTGVAGRTREAVGGVRARRDADPSGTDALLDALGALAESGRDAVVAGDAAAVGAAMTEAHARLVALGVGDPALDHLVHAGLRADALGAKLTGGGRGGCVLLLARDPAHAAHLAEALRAAGAPAVWATDLEDTR